MVKNWNRPDAHQLKSLQLCYPNRGPWTNCFCNTWGLLLEVQKAGPHAGYAEATPAGQRDPRFRFVEVGSKPGVGLELGDPVT